MNVHAIHASAATIADEARQIVDLVATPTIDAMRARRVYELLAGIQRNVNDILNLLEHPVPLPPATSLRQGPTRTDS